MMRIGSLSGAVIVGLLISAAAWAQAPKSSFKFDFGPGKAADGYTKVNADTVYSAESGFGFDFNTKPTGVERGGNDPMHDGFVTSDKPFMFSAKVPEG